MKAFWEKYREHAPDLGEREVFEMMSLELKKAKRDFKKDEDYCEHIANLMEMCSDFLEVKGYGNVPLLTK